MLGFSQESSRAPVSFWLSVEQVIRQLSEQVPVPFPQPEQNHTNQTWVSIRIEY